MVDVAEVWLWDALVGAVRWDAQQRLGYFQFAPEFTRLGWEVAPIKMPLRNGSIIYSFPELRQARGSSEDTFKGLPGMLADALPDRYGNRLIQTWLAQQGRSPQDLNPVETLCFIGSRAMGALEFKPRLSLFEQPTEALELDNLVHIARQMMLEKASFTTRIDPKNKQGIMDVLKIGTSAGGARPKAVIAYHPQTQEIRSGQGRAPEGFEHWLIKLDGVSGEQFGESLGWGRVEYAYYLMAVDCGIQMSPSQLLEENGRAHFMTRRFDRENNEKHHVQTLCGLQHFDFNDMSSYSYEQVFQTMRTLKLTYPEAEEMFRRMVFNVLATNFDDHTKNFAFLLERGGHWKLAPAYDLCFSYDPSNFWVSQQTLSIRGKRTNISEEDFLEIAKDNSIKRGKDIIHHVNAVLHSWEQYAQRAGVREDLVVKIGQHLGRF